MFDHSEATPAEKYKAFKAAATAHVAYLTAASNGKGVDRHLLGLRLVKKADEAMHPLFTHPSFKTSGSWILSTSALFSGERVWGTGFGCVESEGYGMNYLVAGDIIKVGIESKKSCAKTSTKKYRATLAGVFRDVKRMIEEAKSQPKL
jgi:carnitine O-acetyltransferase